MTEAETKAALKEKSKPKVPIHVFHSRADAERAAAGKPVDVEAGDRMKVSMVLNPKQAARRGRERRERLRKAEEAAAAAKQGKEPKEAKK